MTKDTARYWANDALWLWSRWGRKAHDLIIHSEEYSIVKDGYAIFFTRFKNGNACIKEILHV